MLKSMDLDYLPLYFPSNDFSDSKIQKFFEAFVTFFKNDEHYSKMDWKTSRILYLTIKQLSLVVNQQVLEQNILKYPDSILSGLSLAAHYSIVNDTLPYFAKFHVSITDWKSPIKLVSELTAEFVGSFIRVRGIIHNSSMIVSKNKEYLGQCSICGHQYTLSHSECSKCKDSKIVPLKSDYTYQNYQIFEMSDIFNYEISNPILKCYLFGEMVNSIRLGEIVDVTGILKFEENPKSDRNFSLKLEVNYINKLQDTKSGYISSFIRVSDGDMIQSLSGMNGLFYNFISSFGRNIVDRSAIYLHPMIKASLLLCIFSTPKDPLHIVLSRYFDDLYELIKPLVPLSVIFNEASTNKLSSYIDSKNNFIGGSFIQANQGLLMINDVERFRLIQNEYQQILEKGWERIDVLHKVYTKFSSIVIANPKQLFETVKQNAFTQIFEIDEEMAKPLSSYSTTPRSNPVCVDLSNDNLTLEEQLTRINMNGEKIDQATFLKYVTYARQFVHPNWAKSAIKTLKDIASKTMRDMLIIKNMAQCRARIELRATVESSDVIESAELLEWSRNHKNQQNRQKGNRSSSRKTVIYEFMKEFKRIAQYKQDDTVDLKEMQEIAKMVNAEEKYLSFDEFLDALTVNNFVLMSGPKKYRVGSTL